MKSRAYFAVSVEYKHNSVSLLTYTWYVALVA